MIRLFIRFVVFSKLSTDDHLLLAYLTFVYLLKIVSSVVAYLATFTLPAIAGWLERGAASCQTPASRDVTRPVTLAMTRVQEP